MKKWFGMFAYYFHKIQKKIRLVGIRGSQVHGTSKLESGTSFVASSMDKYSFCGYDCDIFLTQIGAYCSIADGVVIGGNAHPVDWVSTSPVFYNNTDSVKKKFSYHERIESKRTIIGNDVWIGRNALIKQGVTIGHGVVIGMGSVVTKDIEPYAIVGGSPAKLIRKRFSPGIIGKLLDSKWWSLDERELARLAPFIKDPEQFLKQHPKWTD